MQLDNALAVALTCGVFGLVILIVLWPGERQGARLLAKWGLPEATPDQVAMAVRYLRRRRFWYPWLFVGLPSSRTPATCRTPTAAARSSSPSCSAR